MTHDPNALSLDAGTELRVFLEDNELPRDALNAQIDETFVAPAKVRVPEPEEYERWRKERWMKTAHMPSVIAKEPWFVLKNWPRMLMHTFRGSSLLSGCTRPRWIRIAALSVSTLPSGSCSVGICLSGLTRASSSIPDAGSHDAAFTIRNSTPIISSAASIAAEPEPFAP
jgi:hypothetical protein